MGQIKYFLFLVLLCVGVNASAQSRYPAAEKARDGFFKVFNEKVHTPLISVYQAYLDLYGNRIGAGIIDTYDFLAPKSKEAFWKLNDLVYNADPEFFDQAHRIPAPLKIAHEDLMFTLYGAYFLTREASTGRELDIGALGEVGTLAFKARAGITPTSAAQNKRLNRLLDEIRPHTLDKGMAKCLRIYAVPKATYELAVNTGCNIFIFQGMYDIYTDGQLRALIAHETVHSSMGDSLKRFGYVAKTIGYHLSKLTIEELNWLMTGEELEYLRKTGDRGNIPVATEVLNKDYQEQELRADKYTSIILNRAGFSANDAISLAKASYGIKQDSDAKVVPDDFTEAHPPAYKRINAIKSGMKF